MAYTPNIPTTAGVAQIQIPQISSNFTELRAHEIGSTVANLVAGQIWADSSSTNVHLLVRDKGNAAWMSVNFTTGTRLFFQQPTAPLGWNVVVEDFHDATIRILNNGVATAWTTGVDFATAIQGTRGISSSTNVGATALSTAQIPTHTHGSTGGHGGHFNGIIGISTAVISTGTDIFVSDDSPTTAGSHEHASFGETSAHTHLLDLKYADTILCQISSAFK